MTDREKAIVMAYTGVAMLSGDKLGIFYQYVREKLGRCVMTHELAFPEVQDAITDAAKNDFIELAKGNSVPAVPLDKMCEWLETDCILSCVSCEHLFGGQWCKQHPELPYRCHRKEHWKDVLTKWMGGLDDHR